MIRKLYAIIHVISQRDRYGAKPFMYTCSGVLKSFGVSFSMYFMASSVVAYIRTPTPIPMLPVRLNTVHIIAARRPKRPLRIYTFTSGVISYPSKALKFMCSLHSHKFIVGVLYGYPF